MVTTPIFTNLIMYILYSVSIVNFYGLSYSVDVFSYILLYDLFTLLNEYFENKLKKNLIV